MDSVNQNAAADDIHRVNDVLPQLLALLLLIGLIAVWIYIPFGEDGDQFGKHEDTKQKLEMLAALSIGFLPLIGLVFLRLKAIWGGVVVNNTQRTLDFPGGGISANGLGDFF